MGKTNRDYHNRLNALATKAAVVVASILVCSNFVAWQMTNSLSLQASLIDSLLDVGASLLNFFALRHAITPPDAEHRFGHGKFEAIASLGQSVFIAASALWLIIECLHRLYHPEIVTHNNTGNVVMGSAVILTLLLILFQRKVYKKTKSLVVKTDCLHYQTDFLTSAAVLFSLNLSSYLGMPFLDSIIGGGIALYIGYASWTLLKNALDQLMDRELPEKDLEKIYSLARGIQGVLGVHDLRTRSAGHQQFIQMHLDLSPTISLLQAHTLSNQVVSEIKQHFHQAEVLIHQDPFGHDEEL